MSEDERGAGLPWGESPYDTRTPAEVVHDYAMVRGDLSEEYARQQLSQWIERYAKHVAARATEGLQTLATAPVSDAQASGGEMVQ